MTGGRNWRLTVPLTTAREWGSSTGDALSLALFDPRSNTETQERVELPPGALGRRVELATLIVRAR